MASSGLAPLATATATPRPHPALLTSPRTPLTTLANTYGNEVLEQMKSYSWMKLGLDPSGSTQYDEPSLVGSEGKGVLAKPAHKSPVDICADCLTEIAKFAYSVLEKRMGKEILDTTPIEFWLTVPAVWSDKAKDDTLRAAKIAFRQANISLHPDSLVFLVREPEAAAVAIMTNLTKGGSQQQFQAGDSIMICDCSMSSDPLELCLVTNGMFSRRRHCRHRDAQDPRYDTDNPVR